MKWFKLIAFSTVFAGLMIIIASCKKDSDLKNDTIITKSLPMSASQEVPANPSTATGTIDLTYNRDTKVMTYTVTWSGLTDTLIAMHIHNTADPGYNAGVLQNIITASNGIATPGPKFIKSGTISATLYIDGQVFKEEHLLANKYYMNIHTKTYPGGEIRGQLNLR